MPNRLGALLITCAVLILSAPAVAGRCDRLINHYVVLSGPLALALGQPTLSYIEARETLRARLRADPGAATELAFSSILAIEELEPQVEALQRDVRRKVKGASEALAAIVQRVTLLESVVDEFTYHVPSQATLHSPNRALYDEDTFPFVVEFLPTDGKYYSSAYRLALNLRTMNVREVRSERGDAYVLTSTIDDYRMDELYRTTELLGLGDKMEGKAHVGTREFVLDRDNPSLPDLVAGYTYQATFSFGYSARRLKFEIRINAIPVKVD